MAKQEFTWALAAAMLAAHALKRVRDDDQEGPRLLLQDAFAQAGTFQNAPTRSANDVAAVLLILVVIWWWNYAKYSAVFSGFARSVPKNAPPDFFPEPAAEPVFTGLPVGSVLRTRCAILNTSPQ